MRLRTRLHSDQAQTQTRRNASRTLLASRLNQKQADRRDHEQKEENERCGVFHRLTCAAWGPS
jgi:hypothetical protein